MGLDSPWAYQGRSGLAAYRPRRDTPQHGKPRRTDDGRQPHGFGAAASPTQVGETIGRTMKDLEVVAIEDDANEPLRVQSQGRMLSDGTMFTIHYWQIGRAHV